MDFFTMEPERYFSFPNTYTRADRDKRLSEMIQSGEYLWSEKTDGNYARFIVQNGKKILQTRGISKTTGGYGDISSKVFFYDSLASAFNNETIIIGEVFCPGGIDRDVGSVLRCIDEKAIARQSEVPLRFRIFDVWYYDGKDLMSTPIQERAKYIEKAVGRINNELVCGVVYHFLTDAFYDELDRIFSEGGEGCVIYHKEGTPDPGARTSWKTLKIKQSIQDDIDCFICGILPPTKEYLGKHVDGWRYWENTETGELLCCDPPDDHDTRFVPVSKGYYNKWPSAIVCAVYDNAKNMVPLCAISGISDEFRNDLKENFTEKYYMTPVKISGMAVSSTDDGYSIRHPKLVCLRDGDMNAEDCTLEKIINGGQS